jgi:prepilin-type N-terminal cleavage/methylation domain-containing protein
LTQYFNAARGARSRGFTLLELLIVVAIILVVLAIALPSVTTAMKTYKTAGDVRGLAAQIALAKMRAAADFTDARVNFNSFVQNTSTGTYQYQIEVYNQTTSAWGTDQTGSVNTGQQNLSTGTLFGFGSINLLPSPSSAGGYESGSITNSSTIMFNSRGVPVTGTPGSGGSLTNTANYAVYLNNGNGAYYGITVSPSGNIQMWQWNGAGWSQFY